MASIQQLHQAQLLEKKQQQLTQQFQLQLKQAGCQRLDLLMTAKTHQMLHHKQSKVMVQQYSNFTIQETNTH